MEKQDWKQLSTKSVFPAEKFLLLFLILRPTVDFLRDVTLFSYKNTSLNVNAAIGILFFCWAMYMAFKYAKTLRNVPAIILFSLSGILTLASVFYSIFPFTTMVESLKYINVVLIFAISYVLTKEKKIKPMEFLYAIVLSAVIPICVGLFQLLTGAGINTFGVRGRIFGTFSHPNLFAFYILFLLILHIQFSTLDKVKFWEERPNLKIATYALLLLLLVATYTRAAWIGLTVFLLFIGIIQFRKMLLYVVLTGVGLFGFLFITDAFLDRYTNVRLEQVQLISRVTSRNEDADSVSWRVTLINESAPIIFMRPVFGYGYGTFEIVWERNRSLAHIWDDSAQAHNDYLRLLLELGFVGLVLYCLILLQLAITAFSRSKENYQYVLLFAWIGTYAVISISDNMLHHTPVAWMMWGWWGVAFTQKKHKFKSINFLKK